MSGHWAAQRERGSFALMKLTAWLARHLPRWILAPLLYAIVGYFFIFGARARRSIREYQTRLAAASGRAEPGPRFGSVFAQFIAFGEALLDKLDVWNNRLPLNRVHLIDPHQLNPQLRHGARGQLFLGAHLGNLEVCRALAELGDRVRLNVLVHTRHAEHFNRLMGEHNARHLNLIEVSTLDTAMMLQLSKRLERGEWLAMAADRIPVHGARTVSVNFLGKPARFPQGPWLLAGLLSCPVNLMTCIKQNGHYQVHVERFADAIQWTHRQRETIITEWASRYAERLGQLCLLAPHQWFNFYPFWDEGKTKC